MEEKKYPVLKNELERLERLYFYDILGTEAEDQFDDLTKLTAEIIGIPICQITMMDENWQEFISNYGVDMKGNDRENSFCQYTVVQDNILEVPDTLEDTRFKLHPLVTDSPNLRYYVGAPIMDDEGFVLGTLCGYDVAPKKLSELQRKMLSQVANTVMRIINYRKVNLDQEKYARIFKLNQDLLCIISKDGFFKLVNPAFSQLLGWTEEDLLEQPVKNFIYEADLQKAKTELQLLKTGVPKFDFNCRFISADNVVVGIDWSYFTDEGSNVIVASGHNITELLKTQNSLKKAVKVKDEFLSNISHEIRTPLTAIVGFTDLLSNSNLKTEQREQLEVVDVASKHLMNIVNDLLDAYKLEEGEIVLQNTVISPVTILNDIKKLYNNSALAKNITLNLNIDAAIPAEVLGDRTRLLQIFSNLIGNAIKFTNEGSVTLSANVITQYPDQVKLRFGVKDTGIGISADQQEKIFQRFQQAESTTSKQYGGTGLGLSITHLLIELHESGIQVESKLNEGSHFYFDVLFDLNQDANRTLNPLNAANQNLNGIKILLAEDNPHLQLLCKNYIERAKGEITISADGNEVLTALKNETFDIILMDLQMPILDGLTTTKVIRNKLQLNVPIIGCSAHGSNLEIKECLASEMNDFITKPYEEQALIDKIKQLTKPQDKTIVTDDFTAILNELEKEEGKELVDDFMLILKERIPKDLAELEISTLEKNTEQVYRKAHFLTTSFCTLQFKEGELITTKISDAFHSQQEVEIFSLANKLITYLQRLNRSINE